MISELVTMTVGQLLDLKDSGMLSVNPEYQRGAVWNQTQQKKLIDSVLRGYPLPVIYLHYKAKTVGSFTSVNLEIIDGQQRINALEVFKAGSLNLFDPIADDHVARFPKFVKEQPCPWKEQNFDSLDSELKDRFLNTNISVAQIVTDYEDEARDLFIRLQAGLPLNAQEKRDAWPGGFTEFILKVGGKANNIKYPGHDVFKDLASKNRIDRGQHRQLCAQAAMLVLERASQNNLTDIGTSSIDNYYYKNLSFDPTGEEAQRFIRILTKVYSLLGNRGVKKLKSHELIHLVLLVGSLMEGYAPSWESRLQDAFEKFRGECALAKLNKENEYWNKYVQWTMTSADSKSSILTRHMFFSKVMLNLMKPQALDPTRAYGTIEREIIYYRHDRKCVVCNENINWEELNIHHLVEHQYGGQTTLRNGVPVHSLCHPKGQAATDFAIKYLGTPKEQSTETATSQLS